MIVTRPAPRLGHRSHIRRQIAMGKHRAFGFAGRATGIGNNCNFVAKLRKNGRWKIKRRSQRPRHRQQRTHLLLSQRRMAGGLRAHEGRRFNADRAKTPLAAATPAATAPAALGSTPPHATR